MLLHVRLLLRMLRFHSLRLLRVTRFHLLLLHVARLPLLQLSILLFLLLLHLLVLLILFRSQLLLLLLILRVRLRISRVRRSELVLLHFARMVIRRLPRIVCRTVPLVAVRRIRWRRMIRTTRFPRRYRAAMKIIGTFGRSDWRPALIRTRAQLRISPRRLAMFALRLDRFHMPLATVSLLLRGRAVR